MPTKTLSKISKFCLAVLIACPWGVLFCLPIMIVGIQLIQSPDRLMVRTDGLLATADPYSNRQTKTLDGHPLPPDPNHAFFTTYDNLASNFDDPFTIRSHRWESHLNVLGDQEDPENPRLWYLCRDRFGSGLAYFQGYSLSTRKQIGFIGVNGFRETLPPPEERFQLPAYQYLGSQIQPYSPAASQISAGSWGSEYGSWTGIGESVFQILTRDGIWLEGNFSTRTVRELLPGTILRSVTHNAVRYFPGKEGDLQRPDTNLSSKPFLQARTDDELLSLTYRRSPETILIDERINIPEGFRARNLCWIRLLDGSGLLKSTLGFDAASNEDRYLIQRHDAAGKFSEPETIGIKRQPISPVVFSAVPILVPPAISGAIAMSQRGLFGVSPRESPEAYLMMQLWPIPLLVSLICGSIVFVHARRNGLSVSEQAAYAVLGLLGGLPGLAGYLTHRNWPLQVKCSSCGATAPLLQATCSVCRREFPDPAPLGTEIFA